MTNEYLVTKEPRMPPVHPGEMLREDVLPALGLSVSEAARQLGVSRQTLHRIMAGTHSITPEMAEAPDHRFTLVALAVLG